MALFKRGFAKYLDTGQFSDLILVHEGKEYPVHRVVLAFSSEFFSRLLLGEWKDSNTARIELKFPDPEGIFPEVLRFMYNGCVQVTAQNAIPLLAMADHYLIPSLKRVTGDYISRNITRENAIEILKRAVSLDVNEVIDKCITCIAKNWCHLPNTGDVLFLPHAIFLQLLRYPYLAVKDEWSLYQLVNEYVKLHAKELQSAQAQSLYETIRFRWMTYEQITQVEQNLEVPRNLIVEALMARLKQHEVPENVGDEPAEGANLRLQKRISAGIEFEYTSDFDDRGIIYWIATNCLRTPWVNPHLQGVIRVAASSVERGNPHDLVSRQASEMWTKDVPASWFMVDLGKGRTVMPTHYTLRHGGNYRADSLRTWDLQGSADGQTWTLLRRHANDKSLNSNFASHTWPLPGVNRAYRFFRILQTGRNSNNHNFLVISGFELYGNLYDNSASDPAQPPPPLTL